MLWCIKATTCNRGCPRHYVHELQTGYVCDIAGPRTEAPDLLHVHPWHWRRLDTQWQTLWSADAKSMCQEGCQDTWKIAATCGLTERRCRVSWLGICCRRASSMTRPAAPAAGSRCRSRDLAACSSSGTAPSAPAVCRTVKAAPIYTHAHKQTCFAAGHCGHVCLADAACTDDRLRLLSLRGQR